MAIKAFKKILMKTFETVTLQENVAEFTNSITSNPLLDGLLLKDISVSTSSTDISHKLGRNLIGFIITNADADVNVWKSATQSNTTLIVALTASATATVDIWVF